jgi:predicted enzyme related to lactoylglutathione lyase
MSNPVNWFNIGGKDGKKLTAFYKKVFSWKTSAGPGGMTMVAPEKGGIAGGIMTSMLGAPGTTIYVSVENLEKQLKKIMAAGGKAAGAPMELPEGMGRIAHFTDPEGIVIGLWEPGKKPAKKAAKKPAKKAAKKK